MTRLRKITRPTIIGILSIILFEFGREELHYRNKVKQLNQNALRLKCNMTPSDVIAIMGKPESQGESPPQENNYPVWEWTVDINQEPLWHLIGINEYRKPLVIFGQFRDEYLLYVTIEGGRPWRIPPITHDWQIQG